jgi:uncharacterized protein YjbJ (UPF0337 family)
MSSGKEKQADGTVDKMKGKAKEAWGAVTNDSSKRLEGQGDQIKGGAKQKVGKVQDDLER